MKKALLVMFVSLAFSSPTAFAYIDPGSGSAIMSAVIGFFVAVGMAVKTYWYKIKGFFQKSPDDQDSPPKNPPPSPD